MHDCSQVVGLLCQQQELALAKNELRFLAQAFVLWEQLSCPCFYPLFSLGEKAGSQTIFKGHWQPVPSSWLLPKDAGECCFSNLETPWSKRIRRCLGPAVTVTNGPGIMLLHGCKGIY